MASRSTWSYVCIGCFLLNVSKQLSEEPALNTAGFFLSDATGLLFFWLVGEKARCSGAGFLRVFGIHHTGASSDNLYDLKGIEYCFAATS